jgi:succinyl-CoA synthetase beta subunit
MNIHEYQTKALLAKYGVATPRGQVTYAVTGAKEVARAGRLGVGGWA